MSKLIQLLILIECVLAVISTSVTLLQNNYLSTPNSTQFKLKCKFHLEKYKQTVQRVDMTKDNRVFYSVEYTAGQLNHPGNHDHPGLPEHVHPVTNFNKVSGIQQMESNDTNVDSNLMEGWTSIMIRRKMEKLIPGTYRCKVHYLDDHKRKAIESDKVYIEEKKETVKLNINHKVFHRGNDIKLECRFKLLKKDKFAGLSLTKDNHEFFRFFDKKNHSMVKVPGIDKVLWTAYEKEIRMTIKKAQNMTQGIYSCLFNFTKPFSEQQVISISDMSRIVFKNSKESKLSKTWVLLLLFMIYVSY